MRRGKRARRALLWSSGILSSSASREAIRLRDYALCEVACSSRSRCPRAARRPPPPPAPGNELVVFLRQGAVTRYSGSDDQGTGLDYDLARLFAAQQGLKLKVVPASNPVQRLLQNASMASIGAGGIYRLPERSREASANAIVYSSAYYAIEPVLIYNIDGFRPGAWKDLAGETVGVLEGSGLDSALATIRNAHPEVQWQPVALPSTEALISQVSDGTMSYAVVASNEANATRSVYLGFDTAFMIGGKQELAWVFPKAETRAARPGRRFFARCRRDGTLARLIERYYSRGHGQPSRRRRFSGAHPVTAAAVPLQLRARTAARPASSGACWRRSPTRNRSGTRRRPARPAYAA